MINNNEFIGKLRDFLNMKFIHGTSMLLTGSIAEGLESPTSDVDIFYFGPQAITPPLLNLIFEDRKIELTFWGENELNLVLDDLNRESYIGLSQRRLEQISKLIRGFVIDGPIPEQLLIIRNSSCLFMERLICYFYSMLQPMYDDVVGSDMHESEITASYQARCLFEFALEAFLVAGGDFYLKTKWRPRRIDRTYAQSEPVAIIFRKSVLGSPEQVRIKDFLYAVRRIFFRAILAIPDNIPQDILLSGSTQYCISSWVFFYADGDRYYVKSKQVMYSIDLTTLKILAAFNEPSNIETALHVCCFSLGIGQAKAKERIDALINRKLIQPEHEA